MQIAQVTTRGEGPRGTIRELSRGCRGPKSDLVFRSPSRQRETISREMAGHGARIEGFLRVLGVLCGEASDSTTEDAEGHGGWKDERS